MENPVTSLKAAVELNPEQQLAVLQAWEKGIMAISQLVKIAFPDIESSLQDGRSLWGRAVKEFLIAKGLTPTSTSDGISSKRTVELTEAHKEYILNHCSKMKPLEMARELFGHPRLSPASVECRAVNNHFRSIDPKIIFGEEIPEPDYNPPKQTMHVLGRIKKYVSETETWEQKKLSPIQKKCCESLIHYLHDYRFKRQIDSYEKTEDKITFESEFVKYTYNKSDLEQEEISQYISLCSFIVMEFNIKQHIEMLQVIIEQEFEENQKVNHALVQALESARQDLNNLTIRQGKLYEALTEKRSEKLSKEIKDKASLLNIINVWKIQESRQQILKLAKEKKEKLREEIHKLENLDEMKYRCLGLSEDEILNG